MNLARVLEKFELLVDVPKSVWAIREIVLQLAVRGMLTKRVEGESVKEQQDQIEAFRVRRERRVEPEVNDGPFLIPTTWAWVPVGDAMELFNGKAFKQEDWSSEGTPIIRIQNLNNESAAFNRCNSEVEPRFHVTDGDLLISWSGTPGTSFGAFIWNRGSAYLNQHIFRCELPEGVYVKEFLRLAVNARLDEMISGRVKSRV